MSLATAPLLCITPGPAIDRTAFVERIVHDEVLRPRELVVLPGGKGVNAARAALRLGGAVRTTGVAGGHAGRWIVEALRDEGLQPHFFSAAAESRTTYVTIDDQAESVMVYERPGAVTGEEWQAFLALLETELVPACARAVVAGSLPGEVDPEGYASIVEVCRRVGRPLLVDTSGANLIAAIAAKPDVVKVGRVEAVEAGLVEANADATLAAQAIVAAGAALAVITDGPGIVAAADAATVWHIEVPRVDAVNAVGSGDAFDAALSLALLRGDSLAEALSKGVAAGSANAMAPGAGMLDATVAQQLEAKIVVSAAQR